MAKLTIGGRTNYRKKGVRHTVGQQIELTKEERKAAEERGVIFLTSHEAEESAAEEKATEKAVAEKIAAEEKATAKAVAEKKVKGF